MKKLLVLMLVLGLASAAQATNLSWSESSTYELDWATGATIYVASDDALAYSNRWINDSDGILITGVTPLAAAGDDADWGQATSWWYISAIDSSEPFNIASGNQWEIALAATSDMVSNTYDIILDVYGGSGGPVTLAVHVIPEPATIALLGLGGLFLLRRRRK